MTRINCGIPPAELTDKHLLAEHREIKRIPNCISKGRYSMDGQPKEFTLGKGHVKFFYDKLKYLHRRYKYLYEECIKRGFKVQDYNGAFYGMPPSLYNDYQPNEQDRRVIRERIKEKLNVGKLI